MTTMAVKVPTNGHAKTSLLKCRLVTEPCAGCRWCGGLGRFEYCEPWRETMPLWFGPFCSVACFKSYSSE